MKPYGVPRVFDLEDPHYDMIDVRRVGGKSSKGRNAGKGGDVRNSQHSKNKQDTRRIWKGRERQNTKAEINKAILGLD